MGLSKEVDMLLQGPDKGETGRGSGVTGPSECPGCRICPVVGATGARFGACSASHLNTL